MRILLSESCNANCAHCFNRGFRKSGHMDLEGARRVFDFLGQHVDKLLIMGGEPTLHPDFAELYGHAQRRFESVLLFTNALNDGILSIRPRPADAITYNARLIGRDFKYEKMLPGVEFGRALDVVVSTHVAVDDLKRRIIRAHNNAVRNGIDDLGFILTLDITADNFAHREQLNASWRALLSFVAGLGIERLSIDHPVPLCFWDEESMRLNASVPTIGRGGDYPTFCSLQSAGLLNAEFELLHCNQYPVRLGSIFSDPGREELISFAELNRLFRTSHELRMARVAQREDCSRCEHFPRRCNGGCFILRSEAALELPERHSQSTEQRR
jgi:radical SAM protein with 4Fe4S-binding SPASM domain